MVSFGVGVSFFFAAALAGVYVLLAAFGQALESLSSIRRRALLEEDPERLGKLLAKGTVSRIAVRLASQGSMLFGLLFLGTALAPLQVPEPWLVAGLTVLFGWIFLETLVLRWVAGRGAERMLEDFTWLVPLVALIAAPLTPFLSRLVDRDPEPEEPAGKDEREATRETDVRALLDIAREEGILEKHEEDLVSRAVGFGDRTVREVMTPRPDITFADASLPLAEIVDIFSKTKFTRIPVVEGSIDRPVGIVHVKDVLTAIREKDPPKTARPLAREAFFAPETQTVATLLADFRRRRQHLAIVVDEYGAVTGLATLEDLVEELVGELADEHDDALDPVLALPDGSWSVAGRVRVDELAGTLGTTFPQAEFDTVAGLLSERLGRIPKTGESVTEGGLVFTVEEADRRRVHRVRVQRVEAPVAAGSGGR